MDADQYLAERVQDQIDWHSDKSSANQRSFKQLQVLIIVATALLPLLAGLEDRADELTYAIGAIGVLVAIVTGVVNLFRFNELWIDYRLTAAALTQEKFLYLTRAAPYHEGDLLGTLVQRVEAILSEQRSQWQQIVGGDTPSKGEEGPLA